MTIPSGYQKTTKLSQNDWITDPRVEDPDNIPEPLGWNILLRPYPVKETFGKSSLIIASESIDYINYTTNVARVVAIGPCCWNRTHHRDANGNQFKWVEVGDFVSYPKNTGSLKKYKGVSYVLIGDDEVVERLRDPHVFEEGGYELDIPEEDLKKYNTIYNPNFNNGK